MSKWRGIDYSRGTANFNPATGIHFGVISTNAQGLSDWFWESLEADYGDPACPKCGGEVIDYEKVEQDFEYENYHTHSCSDYCCENCKLVLGSDEVYGDEPVCHRITEEGYEGHSDSHGDLWILDSPYYTLAQYCSPCAPGAGHLENPCEDGVKTYCLGFDWFEDNKAPYPVYSVATGELVPCS